MKSLDRSLICPKCGFKTLKTSEPPWKDVAGPAIEMPYDIPNNIDSDQELFCIVDGKVILRSFYSKKIAERILKDRFYRYPNAKVAKFVRVEEDE